MRSRWQWVSTYVSVSAAGGAVGAASVATAACRSFPGEEERLTRATRFVDGSTRRAATAMGRRATGDEVLNAAARPAASATGATLARAIRPRARARALGRTPVGVARDDDTW